MIKEKIKKITPSFIKNLGFFFLNPIIMKQQQKRKINIGTGGEKLLGFISIDNDPSTKPDIVRDIEKGLPFDDNSVDEIKCSHTLEHIHDLLFVLREFYRVCRNGAKITIIVPLMDASDMTHVRFFDENTFRTLIDPIYWDKPYYFVGKYKEISRSFRQLSTCREMTLALKVIK
ncbi:MAG: methyltransferase domain-containing protein [bacterium]|nr:methyltransferase domain-containing protein [bacterium]